MLLLGLSAGNEPRCYEPRCYVVRKNKSDANSGMKQNPARHSKLEVSDPLKLKLYPVW